MDARSAISGLKRGAEHASNARERLVLARAVGGLVIQIFESSQWSMEQNVLVDFPT